MSLTSNDITTQSSNNILKKNTSSNNNLLASESNTKKKTNLSDKTPNIPIATGTDIPKTFTVHGIKQVVKEIKPKEVELVKKDNIKKIKSKEIVNLQNKTNSSINDDKSFQTAQTQVVDAFIKTKSIGYNHNPKAIAISEDKKVSAKALSSSTILSKYGSASTIKNNTIPETETQNGLPSFSLNGKTANSFILSDDDSSPSPKLGIGNPSVNIISSSDLINDKLVKEIGYDKYKKLSDTFDVLKDFTDCMDMGDIFGGGADVKDGSSIFDALDDLLNTSIDYDLGYVVDCLLPAVKLLDNKSLNKVVDKVGSKGSLSIFKAIASGGDKDKLLGSFHKTKKTMRKSKSNFSLPEVISVADSVMNSMDIDKSSIYEAKSDPYSQSAVPAIDDQIADPIFSLSAIKEDVNTTKDFVDYSIEGTTASLLGAIPSF